MGAFQWVSPKRLMSNSVKKFGRFAQPFGSGEWYSVSADGSSLRILELPGKGSIARIRPPVTREAFFVNRLEARYGRGASRCC
jgi:hypothetical protein